MIPPCRVGFGEGSLIVRPESWDYGIARSVLLDNEYRLPARFDPDDVILDIGAHIGAFAYACLQRGAGRVIAFEPEPENFALAAENLASHANRCELHPAAIWRSDHHDDAVALRLRRARHPLNTGGHDVLGDAASTDGGIDVQAIPLDAVLERVERPIRLLKIDCEGAEYPILLTATRLAQVTAIVGEYHRFGPGSEHGDVTDRMRVAGTQHYDSDALFKHLREQGFEVETASQPDAEQRTDHGVFFARRGATVS